MRTTERALASVKPITYVKEIPNADAIECAIVADGWPVVVKKGEFSGGDNALYLEIDTWVPTELAPFLSKDRQPRQYNGVAGERLKTVKFRGQVSQGLLFPLSAPIVAEGLDLALESGRTFDDVFNLQKWEAPVPACLAGISRGNFPHYVPKTDQERCQNLHEEIFISNFGELYEVTTKLDGSSMTVLCKDEEIHVCSRNLDLAETEANSYWAAAHKQNLLYALLTACKVSGKEYALQGELIGEGIQGNPEKLKGREFILFDVYSITERRYLTPVERSLFRILLMEIGAQLGHVPVIDVGLIVTDKFFTVDELLEFAEGPSLNFNTTREGLVFKAHSSGFSFKAISNKFLLKKKE